MNKILCVAVHPDDETLGCGGTLLKHKANGDEIYWLLITGPSFDAPNSYNDQRVIIRKEIMHNIEQAYKFNGTEYLALPPGLVHTIDLREIVQRLSNILYRIKPNIIYTPFFNDVHSDHRRIFEAVYSCTKSFRYPFIDSVYMMETLSETEFAPSIPTISFTPNVFVNITNFIEPKLAIMSLYTKQLMDEPYPRSISSIKALARIRGSRAGVMYAEAFQLLYQKIL